jgi:23S rRNA-/tRNA-specific pseudouridylate synthase
MVLFLAVIFQIHTQKSVGMPLLGDPIYKDGLVQPDMEPSRCYLHATAIHIPCLTRKHDANVDDIVLLLFVRKDRILF